jgi:hypothetical protein
VSNPRCEAAVVFVVFARNTYTSSIIELDAAQTSGYAEYAARVQSRLILGVW